MHKKDFQLLYMATNPGKTVANANAIYDQVYPPSVAPAPTDIVKEKARDDAVRTHMKNLESNPAAHKTFQQLPYLDQIAELGL